MTIAFVIGNGISRQSISLPLVQRYGKTYGCNALYRDFAPDFLVAVGDTIVEEIANSDYPTDKIVYAHAEELLAYPGKFYLIPQNLKYNAGTIAAYIAAFDGHKKVFLLGFDSHYGDAEPVNNVYRDTNGYAPSGTLTSGEFADRALAHVVSVYNDVDFVRVASVASMAIHSELNALPNFRQVDYRQFVAEADIG
mgnify:CR=1 FL=1